MTWIEKHRPDDWEQLQGNNKAIEELRSWAEEWTDGDSPKLLHGEPGTGKTTAAYLLADELGVDLLEIDTSTARKTADIEEISRTMDAGEKLVLLDEADSWPSQVNLNPLYERLKEPSNPVVITVNSEYDTPETIKGPSSLVEFSLSKASRRAKLKEVASAEGIPLDEDDLDSLAGRQDLRSAINDLQAHALMDLPIEQDQRELDGSDFAAMDQIIQQEDASEVDMSPPWMVQWLDENARKEMDNVELAAAQDALSRADKHLGGSHSGDYRGWRYAAILGQRVADLHLTDPYQGWIRWDFPTNVRSSPSPDDDTPEAQIYRELVGRAWEPSSIHGGYIYFRETILPLLDRLERLDKFELVKEEGLSEEAAEAIGVTSEMYETLTIQKEPEAGEELEKQTSDAMGADW